MFPPHPTPTHHLQAESRSQDTSVAYKKKKKRLHMSQRGLGYRWTELWEGNTNPNSFGFWPGNFDTDRVRLPRKPVGV